MSIFPHLTAKPAVKPTFNGPFLLKTVKFHNLTAKPAVKRPKFLIN
jgi:hypothetical protein